MNSPFVYVIILNWNRWQDTIECVASVLQADYPRCQVLVVDNGSTDGSPEKICNAFPEIELIINQENLGFAAGNNEGLRYALRKGAEYVLLLNNDTIIDKELLRELVSVGESDSRIGLLVPKICYYNDRARIWAAGARQRWFPPRVTIIGTGRKDDCPSYNLQREVDFATGCGIMIKAKTLRKVGLLDPAYFLYHEDYDFCMRLRRNGYKIIYVPKAVMWHKISASTEGKGASDRWYHWAKNAVIFYHKNYRLSNLLLAIFALWVVIRELLKGDISFIKPYARGLRDGLMSPSREN